MAWINQELSAASKIPQLVGALTMTIETCLSGVLVVDVRQRDIGISIVLARQSLKEFM